MTEKSRAKELVGYSFLVVFANDDTIDEKELTMIERLALEDGVVDDKEKEILRRLFDRLDHYTVARKVVEEINSFRKQHDI